MEKISNLCKNNTLDILFLLGGLGIIVCYGLGFIKTVEHWLDIPSGIIVYAVELFFMIALCIFATSVKKLDEMLTLHLWIIICYLIVISILYLLGMQNPGIGVFAIIGISVASFILALFFSVILSRNWPDDYSRKRNFC